jgi:Uma2 family endonuclease
LYEGENATGGTMAALTYPLPTPQKAGPFTPDDLPKLEQHGLFELVDGHLIEKPMGYFSGRTASKLTARLEWFLQEHPIGEVSSEVTFRCFPEKPNQLRRPDIAFISSARLANVPAEGHVPIRPDLAIEVISPGDGVYELDEKLEDYVSAAIPLVWIFNPAARTVRVCKPDRSSRTLIETETLDGGEILPGFALALRDLFPDRATGK